MASDTKGILVGCDAAQEWLLDWWWKNYTQENDLPIAFADFGMSEEGKKWCKKRGVLLPLSFENLYVASKHEIASSIVSEWEKTLSPFWDSRSAWFKKPFALLNTPFQKTIWLDLDCEIIGSLDPIFDYIDPLSKMGLAEVRDPETKREGTLYNSGVIVFEKDSPLLKKWAEAALFDNNKYLGDQDALSQVIFDEKAVVGDLPEIYNWRMCGGFRLDAIVLHWAALWGKEYIRKHGGLRNGIRGAFKQ